MPKTFPSSQRKKWLSILQTSAARKKHGAKTSPSLSVVLDANVWYSAFLHGGVPKQVVKYCLDFCKINISETLIEELLAAMEDRVNIPYRWRRAIKLALRETCEMWDEDIAESVARDFKDDYLLALAVLSKSKYLISGDKDLLVLKSYQRTRIINPVDFLELPLIKKYSK